MFLQLEFNSKSTPEFAEKSKFLRDALVFLCANKVSYWNLLFLCRLPSILLTGLLSWLVWRWAGLAFGRLAGLLGLLLATLSPYLIANGSLAATDLPVTVFIVAALFLAYLSAKDGFTLKRAVLLGLVYGLALATKHTALLFLPWVALPALLRWRSDGWRRVAGGYTCAVFLAYMTIWMVYGLRYRSESPYYVAPDWGAFSGMSVEWLVAIARDVRVFPEAYLYSGFRIVHSAYTRTLPAFLWGQQSTDGWWYYYLARRVDKNAAVDPDSGGHFNCDRGEEMAQR